MASDITALSLSLAPWEEAGYVATAIVIVGCIGESLVEFTAWISDEKIKSLVGRVSALILIAGLALEILTQVKVNSISGRMIAFLSNEAWQAQLQTEQVKERIAWRTLDQKQVPKCTAEFSKFPRQKVAIINLVSDPEVISLANSISNLFVQSGWGPLPTWTTMGAPQGTGISVSVAAGSPLVDNEAASLISSCLNLSDLDSSVGSAFRPSEVIGMAGGGVMGPTSTNFAPIIIWIGGKPTTPEP